MLPKDPSHSWDHVRTQALDAGFIDAGIINIQAVLEPDSYYQQSVDHYETWIDKQLHGSMDYLKRGIAARRDPRVLFPNTQSIGVFLFPYRKKPPLRNDNLKFARYLYGPDYHEFLRAKLTGLLSESGFTPDQYKICVDHSAVLERALAVSAGLGWVGKNTLFIHPKQGSYLFIAVVLWNLPSEQGENIKPDYCGSCTRCLQICPTDAFVSPRVLDAKKCIAYQTLEEKLPAKDTEPRHYSGFVAGCDLCQEVCPFNLKPLKTPETYPEASDAILSLSLSELTRLGESEYKSLVKSSALSRVKFSKFVDNITIAKQHLLSDKT